MAENEIVKKWKTEIHLAEYVDSEYRDNVQVSLIRATVKELERQQAEISLKTEYIQEQRDVIDELKDEIEKLNKAADKLLPIIEEAGKDDWIPCSERLPEESDLYLCTTYNGNVTDLNYSKKHKAFNSFDTDRKPNHKIEVIAWMPIPKPYKGE